MTANRGMAWKWSIGCLLLVAGLTSTAYGAPAQSGAAGRQNVLILYSYSRSLPWESKVTSGLDEYLASVDPSSRPTVFEESLDSARLGDPLDFGVWALYLAEKYRGTRLDAVMTESQQAMGLLLRFPELFPGVRRYFFNFAASGSLPPPTPLERRYSSASDLRKAILAVTLLRPQTKRIIVVNDRSMLGRARTDQIRAIADETLPGPSIELWDDFVETDLLDRAKALPKDAAVLYLPVQRDSKGSRLSAWSVGARLAAASSVPVFSHFDSLIGTGIVGGYMVSARQLGQLMGRIAVLGDSAAPSSGADYAAATMGYYFDSRALKRWGMRENTLPVGSTALFREMSLVERLWPWLLLAAAVFSLESLLLVRLVSVSAERKKANRMLAVERATLEERVRLRTADLAEANERLESLANRDALTGCESRRFFLERAEREFSRAKRYHGDLSLLVLDLDHFKGFNDQHGHRIGDKVLIRLVEVCRGQLRDSDSVGRLGGEEFAILLPETDLEHACVVAERIRAAVAETRLALENGSALGFTASVGVACVGSQDQKLEELVHKADTAMYEAKQHGRNQVRSARVA